MIRKLLLLVLGPALVAGVAVGVLPAGATDSNAAGFVSKINSERRARGLHPYVVAGDLVEVARRHTRRMVEQQRLYHNPNLGRDVSNWQVVGENVGDGNTVDSLHRAFMNSPAHKANIVASDYTQVGVATITDDNGVLWVTQVFRLPFRAPVVTKPTTRHVSRAAPRAVPAPVRQPVRRPVVARPAKPAVVAPLPERPDAAAFVAALAPATAAGDAIGRAAAYADTMAALTR